MKIIESLISSYPLADCIFKRVALKRGLDLEAELTADILMSKEYRLAEADIKLLTALSPDITQGEVSIKFDDTTREELRHDAMSVYSELEEHISQVPRYGYKGSRL